MNAIPVVLTPEQTQAIEVARIGFMATCPFLAHYFYGEMSDVYTLSIPTAATDGRRVFINPEYFVGKKPNERVFILAHEVWHVIMKHPQRMKAYTREKTLRDLEFDAKQFNTAADYAINADLMESGIGQFNPSWLYDPKFTGQDLAEDIYEKIYEKQPPGKGKTFGTAGQGKGGKPDAHADANGGGFDEILEPATDPVTGKEDLPDDAEFKEAIARAAAAAKAVGNMPGSFMRVVEEILDPQVNWREHVRMLITGKIGALKETWDRPNRRRLALNPMMILPGRKGYGCDSVVVGVDTSGSIGDKELAAFFAEVGGVLQDCRPKTVYLMGCDTRVTQVHEANSLDELQLIRSKGIGGGGGTLFEPVFAKVAEMGIHPALLIYLTDMCGNLDFKAPPYPTVWCSTSKGIKGTFGETVEISLD